MHNPKMPEGAIILADLPRISGGPEKGKRIWTCSGCGDQNVWGYGWSHYSSIAQEENGFVEKVYCPQCNKWANTKT